ncbi:hypothetical protein [Streptomyces sp. NPDC005438]|uniref:hypothetical protein n=1 Tax=Streptomyces sp. NPDC005438 TaxID=3156880 RepID=UPI0033B62F2B
MTMLRTASALHFQDPGEAGDLAAFLGRLLRWDRAAGVRLCAEAGVVAVFAQPARFEVLAVRSARLRGEPSLDRTVSAGELLEGIDQRQESATLPEPVTGPAWAGVLPPRQGWGPVARLPYATVRDSAARLVAEFRTRSQPLGGDRKALDALADELWSRVLPDTELPLRAVHAAYALGFLREPDAALPPQRTEVSLLSAGPWLRLRTLYGAVLWRRPGTARGLSVTPV